MSILVLGHRGQVGVELMRTLLPLGRVTGADRAEIDLGDRSALETLLGASAPTTIINAAAYTAVDQAETDAATAHRVNGECVGWIAQWAAAHGALLVHYSTDYVFDGSGDTPWHEDAPTRPLSVYGTSKLEGERAISAIGCRNLVFRTSWVYSEHGSNFVRTMLRLGSERESLSVVDDQHGVPASAEMLADLTAVAVVAHRCGTLADGTYHMVPAGETTFHGVAVRALGRAQANGFPLKVDPSHIAPIPTSQYPLPAMRPHNSRLATGKLERALRIELPDWTIHLDRTVDRLTRTTS
jgi:dTDP-4-dehydrorhamnose reductase